MIRRFLSPLLALLLALVPALGPQRAVADDERPLDSPLVLRDLRRPDVAPTYLILCPDKAVADILPLAKYRSEHGHTVRIATLERVNQAFGDPDRGVLPRSPDPYNPENKPARSLRACVDALRRAAPRHAPLRYLLLVGTAHDANPNGMALPTAVVTACQPPHHRAPAKRLCGDHLYAVPPGAVLPDLAVGRLPARSLDDLAVMVRKTLDAERHNRPGPWRRRVDLLASQSYYSPLADRLIDTLTTVIVGANVPGYLDLTFTYAKAASPYCTAPSRFRDHVVALFNRGPAMLVYVGHGSRQRLCTFRWRGRWFEMFNAKDVPRVDNPHHRTVVISVACDTGVFTRAEPSLGERLVAAPRGPAVFIASSARSEPYANAVLADLVVEEFVRKHPATVGEGLLAVRRALAANHATPLRPLMDLMAATQLGLAALPRQRTDQLTLYNLFGDPALSFPLVAVPATLDAPDRAAPGQAVTLRLAGPVPAGTAHFTLTIRRDRMLGKVTPVPPDHPDAEAEMARTHARANAKTLADARLPIIDGRAEWTVRIPDPCDHAHLSANVYAEGADADAAASRIIRIQVNNQK